MVRTPDTLSLSAGPSVGVDFLPWQILLPNSLCEHKNRPGIRRVQRYLYSKEPSLYPQSHCYRN